MKKLNFTHELEKRVSVIYSKKKQFKTSNTLILVNLKRS